MEQLEPGLELLMRILRLNPLEPWQVLGLLFVTALCFAIVLKMFIQWSLGLGRLKREVRQIHKKLEDVLKRLPPSPPSL